jgi:hypothetical protein
LKKSVLSILFVAVIIPALAQSKDLSGKVSFLDLSTVQRKGAGGVMAPNVLIRFVPQNGASGVLAMTDQYGMATIPILAGTYCAEAYGLDGHPAKLAPDSIKPFNRCFTAVAGKTMEFSLTLAADAKYGGEVPILGVD